VAYKFTAVYYPQAAWFAETWKQKWTRNCLTTCCKLLWTYNVLIFQNVQFDIREKCLNVASLSSEVRPERNHSGWTVSRFPDVCRSRQTQHLDKGTGAKDANLSTYPRTQGNTRQQTPPPANPFLSSPSLWDRRVRTKEHVSATAIRLSPSSSLLPCTRRRLTGRLFHAPRSLPRDFRAGGRW